jgi:hypothetical protein
MASTNHSWRFLTAPSGDSAVLAIVCDQCGLERTNLLPTRSQERHIDIGGDCPGEPQEQEASPTSKVLNR